MEMSGSQQDTGWVVSLDSELSSRLQGIQCQDSLCMQKSSLTPRRRLDLSPEQSSSGSKSRSYRQVMDQEHTSNRCGSLRGGPEEDDDEEDDKENTRERVLEQKSIRVRLFSSSCPEDQPHSVTGSQSESRASSPQDETLDSESLMVFQRLRSRRNPVHTLIPHSDLPDHCLIGDFSKCPVLPVEKVSHQQLQCVSAQTVASLIRGLFSAVVEDFLIIDCRYPYEYHGGHIKGAVNLFTESQILQAFLQGTSSPQLSLHAHRDPGEAGVSMLGTWGSRGASLESGGVNEGASSPRKLIVFHCEFSSERGPRLCQYLRELDRTVNAQMYPHLLYPELYLLQGGYKSFYSCCPELCDPQGYVPMHHRDFIEQLLRFSRMKHKHCRRHPVSHTTGQHTHTHKPQALMIEYRKLTDCDKL